MTSLDSFSFIPTTRLRRVISEHKELSAKIAQLENKLAGHDEQIIAIIRAIRDLTDPKPVPKKRRIGF